ncbi:hypothetical protein PHMEG_00020641 [Phytophthora megakarya]|uniref:Eukaryotic/viral aspartic protease n=1 Tax=Phytophthora megakarya TaxID=4795 RepID=A0A225VR62_9STRA|nr:hypothetical protein PHMEG_00020641 [Phytophthora megakarya]
MGEVEQERVRWTVEATRTLGARQEASETQRLQLQFQDLRATVAALLHPDATTDSNSNAIGDPDSATQKSSVTSAIKGDARERPVYAPVKNLTEVALSQLRVTLPEVKDEPRVTSTKARRRASSAPKAPTVSDFGEASFRQLKSGDSGSTKSGSGKKGSTRPDLRSLRPARLEKARGHHPLTLETNQTQVVTMETTPKRFGGQPRHDDGSGTAAAKTTKDGTTVWKFRPYINYNVVEKFNDTAPKEDRVNGWERFADMAAQGSWPNKMKIRQFRSRMPAMIRHWYAQLPKSTCHNWKLLSTNFKKLYCRTTGSYAERYFTMKMRSSETALLNTAAVKAEIPFQTSSRRRELHLRRFVKKLKDVQLKTALEGHQVQSISEVERVLRRHEDVWREDGYETPPTRTRDARADNLPRGGLKPRRPGHAFLTQIIDSGTSQVEEQPRVADPETPEYGPDDYAPSMPEMTDESYEGYRVSE